VKWFSTFHSQLWWPLDDCIQKIEKTAFFYFSVLITSSLIRVTSASLNFEVQKKKNAKPAEDRCFTERSGRLLMQCLLPAQPTAARAT
jgi:hypothetical protein